MSSREVGEKRNNGGHGERVEKGVDPHLDIFFHFDVVFLDRIEGMC